MARTRLAPANPPQCRPDVDEVDDGGDDRCQPQRAEPAAQENDDYGDGKDRQPGLLRQFSGRKIGSRRSECGVDQRVKLQDQRSQKHDRKQRR